MSPPRGFRAPGGQQRTDGATDKVRKRRNRDTHRKDMGDGGPGSFAGVYGKHNQKAKANNHEIEEPCHSLQRESSNSRWHKFLCFQPLP
jgi:hypothetical protein